MPLNSKFLLPLFFEEELLTSSDPKSSKVEDAGTILSFLVVDRCAHVRSFPSLSLS